MTKGIFITATGTDVGKTFISALIVKKVRELGLNCGYYKPALSGAEVVDGKLIPGDCKYVLTKAGIDKEPSKCASYIFEKAVSPHLASQCENNPIKLSKILNDFKQAKSEYDYLLVEGAGGIVCPFNMDDDILLPDVINALNLDVIIVADAALGTINSTVLTVEYAKNHGINVKGIILNNYDDSDLMQRDNRKSIEWLTGIAVIATVEKNAEDIDIEDLLSLFKEV